MKSLDNICKKHINKFFNIVKLIEDFEIIEWNSKIKRIIIINYNEKFIISNYANFKEKD